VNDKKDIRKAYNAGRYYPDSEEEIEKFIALFNETLNRAEDAIARLSIDAPQAIIVPHDAYHLSGFTANIAHRILAKNKTKRVVVIASAQNCNFKGIATVDAHYYQTPLGNLEIDYDYLNVIATNFPISLFEDSYEQEYKTEVQIPFIKYYQPNVKVIELLYNPNNSKSLYDLIYWLLEDSLTSVVISSNLSQNISENLGNALDTFAINALAKQDSSLLQESEASSKEGIEALLKSAQSLKLSSHILDYRTSTDVTRNKESCTGYTSVAFCR